METCANSPQTVLSILQGTLKRLQNDGSSLVSSAVAIRDKIRGSYPAKEGSPCPPQGTLESIIDYAAAIESEVDLVLRETSDALSTAHHSLGDPSINLKISGCAMVPKQTSRY